MCLKNILIKTLTNKDKFMKIACVAVRFNHENRYEKDKKDQYKHYEKLIAAALVGSVALAKYLKYKARKEKLIKTSDESPQTKEDDDFEAGDKKPDLPVYRAGEVFPHDKKDSFWVIYRHGVYDVTKFIPYHPGGEQIMNAGGLSVEPFWNIYGMHKTPNTFRLLESFRIGNLHDDDVFEHSDEDLWTNEPLRDKRLIMKTKKPFNAESPAKLLIEHFDTPNELFFVRQHMPVPELDAQTHTFQITIVEGSSSRSKEFNLQELQSLFPPRQVRAALMCAGNRRREMNKVKQVRGVDWQQGAICNALWSGVYLRDVLDYCGLDTTDTDGKHIIFTGADMDASGVNFSSSIPLQQALNPNSEILLATHMNGKVLPKDHGYPLRVIVPGAPAFRSIKWLESITISYDESPSFWHQRAYRSLNASETWDTVDFSSAPSIYSLPVTSAICNPIDGDICTVKNGVIEVKGYAYSGGGANIIRVDISPDCGCTWYDAIELQTDDAPPSKHYSWALWTAWIPVQSRQTEMELWAKATDSNFNTQPRNFDDIWNIRGDLATAYHKIKIQLKH